jgi:hypothetical protein
MLPTSTMLTWYLLSESAKSKLPHISLDRSQWLVDAAPGKVHIGENMVLYGRKPSS